MYVMTCPYYKSEKKKTISCEGRIKYFHDTEKKKEYLTRFCCDKWDDCSYALGLSAVYEQTERLPKDLQNLSKTEYYLADMQHTVKKLLQRIGMMEKTIAHMEEVAKDNNEVYQNERRRFVMVKMSYDRAIQNLENCIGYLLYEYAGGKAGEKMEIDTEQFGKFMETHTVTYQVSDDQMKAVYEVKEK